MLRMDKEEQIRRDAARLVVDYFGTQTAVAKVLGYDDLRNVTKWTTGINWFPVEHCVSIERETGGKITRKDLRPLDYWTYWPDLPAPKAEEKDEV